MSPALQPDIARVRDAFATLENDLPDVAEETGLDLQTVALFLLDARKVARSIDRALERDAEQAARLYDEREQAARDGERRVS